MNLLATPMNKNQSLEGLNEDANLQKYDNIVSELIDDEKFIVQVNAPTPKMGMDLVVAPLNGLQSMEGVDDDYIQQSASYKVAKMKGANKALAGDPPRIAEAEQILKRKLTPQEVQQKRVTEIENTDLYNQYRYENAKIDLISVLKQLQKSPNAKDLLSKRDEILRRVSTTYFNDNNEDGINIDYDEVSQEINKLQKEERYLAEQLRRYGAKVPEKTKDRYYKTIAQIQKLKSQVDEQKLPQPDDAINKNEYEADAIFPNGDIDIDDGPVQHMVDGQNAQIVREQPAKIINLRDIKKQIDKVNKLHPLDYQRYLSVGLPANGLDLNTPSYQESNFQSNKPDAPDIPQQSIIGNRYDFTKDIYGIVPKYSIDDNLDLDKVSKELINISKRNKSKKYFDETKNPFLSTGTDELNLIGLNGNGSNGENELHNINKDTKQKRVRGLTQGDLYNQNDLLNIPEHNEHGGLQMSSLVNNMSHNENVPIKKYIDTITVEEKRDKKNELLEKFKNRNINNKRQPIEVPNEIYGTKQNNEALDLQNDEDKKDLLLKDNLGKKEEIFVVKAEKPLSLKEKYEKKKYGKKEEVNLTKSNKIKENYEKKRYGEKGKNPKGKGIEGYPSQAELDRLHNIKGTKYDTSYLGPDSIRYGQQISTQNRNDHPENNVSQPSQAYKNALAYNQGLTGLVDFGNHILVDALKSEIGGLGIKVPKRDLEHIKNQDAPFGRFAIDQRKLNEGIISIRHPRTKHKVYDLPNVQASQHLKTVIKDILDKRPLSVKDLDIHERRYLERLIHKSGINVELPQTLNEEPMHFRGRGRPPSLVGDARQVLKNRFQILTGEIQAGNDSKEIKKELYDVCQEMVEKGLITSRQCREVIENFC